MGPTPHRRLHVRLRLFGGGARGPGTLRAPPGINPRRGSGAGPSPRGELGLPISRCDTEPIHLMNHRRHMYVPRQRARTPLGHSTARHSAELSALDGGTKHGGYQAKTRARVFLCYKGISVYSVVALRVGGQRRAFLGCWQGTLLSTFVDHGLASEGVCFTLRGHVGLQLPRGSANPYRR